MRGLGVSLSNPIHRPLYLLLVPPLATHSAVHKMFENNIVRYCSSNGVQHLLEHLQCTIHPCSLHVASNGRHGGELLHGAPRMFRN